MLNQVIIVGRLANDIEVKELESGKKVCNIVLAVNRSYKNAEGIYETDFIDCVLWDGIASNTKDYCKKGDIVGVKGRLQTDLVEQEDGTNKKYTKVIAEKLTFLSSKSEEIKKDIDKEDE